MSADPRFGRRGAVLVLFALVYATYGAALYLAANAGLPPRGLELLTSRVPLWGLCAGWVGCAAVAIAGSVPPTPVPQWFGFTMLMPMPVIWSGCYLWSWLTWLTTRHGNPLGWAGLLVWGLLIGIVAIVAGWPEPAKQDRR